MKQDTMIHDCIFSLSQFATMSIEQRRENAYLWHSRLGFPDYEKFKRTVETTLGIGITKEDIDLLPWKSRSKMDTVEFQRLQKNETTFDISKYWQSKKDEEVPDLQESFQSVDSVETLEEPEPYNVEEFKQRMYPMLQAYDWYTRLAKSPRHIMERVLAEASNMNITKDELDLLPWGDDGDWLDMRILRESLSIYDIECAQTLFREMDEAQEARVRDDDEDERTVDTAFTEVTLASDIADPIKLHAYEYYLRLGMPNYKQFCAIVTETHGIDLTKDDIGLLPWNADKSRVNEYEMDQLCSLYVGPDSEDGDNLTEASDEEAAYKAYLDEQRRERERLDKEMAAQLKLERLQKEKLEREREAAAANDRHEKELQAKLEAERLEKERQAKLEAERLEKERQAKIDAERLEKERQAKLELDRLEAKRNAKLEKRRLEELARKKSREREEKQMLESTAVASGQSQRGRVNDLRMKERQLYSEVRMLKAYHWHGRLAYPSRSNMKRRIEGIHGCDITADDVDLLPWLPGGLVIDLKAIHKIINEQKRK